jgi:hypothetical protein
MDRQQRRDVDRARQYVRDAITALDEIGWESKAGERVKAAIEALYEANTCLGGAQIEDDKEEQNRRAREDWRKLASRARLLGVDDETIVALAPQAGDGWRKVDKCIKALRAKLEEQTEEDK